MTAIPAHLILKALFDQIVSEAENNPRYAERLIKALPEGIVAEISRKPRKLSQPLFELASVNPVIVLRDEGEIALRSLLDSLTKAQILGAAKNHHIMLSNKAYRRDATKTAIVDALVDAARFRLNERAA